MSLQIPISSLFKMYLLLCTLHLTMGAKEVDEVALASDGNGGYDRTKQLNL